MKKKCKEGVDINEKYLPSKLEYISKWPHNFSPKNVGFTIKWSKCKKSRLLFSQKLKLPEINYLKTILSGVEYICGSSLGEDSGDENNNDLAVIKSVFVKENLSCSLNIELPYCDFLKTICIY